MRQRTTKRSQNKGRKGGMSILSASAAGAAIGAALGGVAGAALINNTTRRVLRQTIDQATRVAGDTIETIQDNRIIDRATKQLGGRSIRKKSRS